MNTLHYWCTSLAHSTIKLVYSRQNRLKFPFAFSFLFTGALLLGAPAGSYSDIISLNCPADIVVECGNSTSPQNTGLATGQSDCGDIVINFFDTNTPGCGNSGIITRTWTATDNCGASTSCEQIITLADNRAPSIQYSAPAGATVDVECNLADDDWSAFAGITAALEVTDDCGSAELSLSHELVEDGICGVTEYLSIWHCTWTATDNCGNSSEFDLFVRIIDWRGPSWLTFPNDLDLNCGDAIPEQSPTATDNCSTVTDIFFEDEIINENCSHSYTIRREWTAVDGCGNSTKDDQLINITDNEPPSITFVDGFINNYTDGEDVYINCIQYGRITQLRYAAHASDNCSDQVDLDFEFEDFGYFNCASYGYSGYIQTRWIATDQCGNSSVATLNWYLIDNSPPRLQNIPDDICVTGNVPSPPLVSGIDECDFVTVNMTDSAPFDCADGQYIERTWTATDACGNASSETQRIYFSDASPPSIRIDFPNLEGLPSGSTGFVPADCSNSQIIAPDILSAVQVEDGCSEVHVEMTLDLLSNGGCVADGFLARYQLQVTATDLCGNESTYELFIHLVDATLPTIETPAVLMVNCGEEIPQATAFDECGEVNDIFYIGTDDIPVSCSSTPQFTSRFWLAIDACGNTNVVEQQIAIVDNTGPVFHNIPADACGDSSIPDDIVAFDECTQMNITFEMTESTAEVVDCGEVLMRSWTATDSCGNQSTATQRIVVADEQAPVLSFAHPLLVTLEDGDLLEIPVGFTYGGPEEPFAFTAEAINALDNCNSTLDVIVSTELIEQEGCVATGFLSQHKINWLVSDACGNASSLSITLAYTDDEAPEILHLPGHLSLYCDDPIPAPADVLIRDNYDQELETSFEEEYTWTSYGLQIIRIWTATDACGNFIEERQRIDLYDNTLEVNFEHAEQVTCNTSNNDITVSVTGGEAPYSYQWEMIDCDGFITSDATDSGIQYTMGYTTQNFSVTITDANGCEKVSHNSIACNNEDINTPPDGLLDGNPVFGAGLSTYPNPAQAYLILRAPLTDTPTDVEVYNVMGQRIYHKRLAQWPTEGWQIDTSNFPAGTYSVKVQAENGAALINRVVIQSSPY